MKQRTIRPIQLVIAPEGKPQFCEEAIVVGLEDEAAGEYITIMACVPGSDARATIALDPIEWPYVCEAVAQLMKTAIGEKL
jgi:hypothetical protein